MTNNTKDENKNINIKNYFSLLFGNFKYFLGLNIMFFIPCAIIISLFTLASVLLTSGVNIYLTAISLVFISPFYSALCHTVVRIINGKKISLLKNYIYGLKDNFLQSFLNGMLFYAAFILIYSALSLYGYLAHTYGGALYISLVVINIIIAIAVLFFFMSVSVITVSFELRSSQIFKNSVLAIFGEMKNNLLALCGLIIIFSLSAGLIFMFGDNTVKIIVFLILMMLFIPSFSALVYFNLLYKSMVSVMSDSSQTESENPAEASITDAEAAEINAQYGENHKDDDYIFYNGKMIKWGKLKEILDSNNDEIK